MASQFRLDGYWDAITDSPCSPPDTYRNHKGTTDVFAQEYLEGWREGEHDKKLFTMRED